MSKELTPLIQLATNFVNGKLNAEEIAEQYFDLYHRVTYSTSDIEGSLFIQIDRFCPAEFSDCRTDDDLDEEQLRYVVNVFLESETSAEAYEKLGDLG